MKDDSIYWKDKDPKTGETIIMKSTHSQIQEDRKQRRLIWALWMLTIVVFVVAVILVYFFIRVAPFLTILERMDNLNVMSRVLEWCK